MFAVLSWFTQPVTTLFLAVLTPTAAFTALNLRFFTSRQAWVSIILALTCGTMIGIGGQWFCERVATTELAVSAASHGLSVSGALCGLVAVSLFFVLHERFLSETVPTRRQRQCVVWGSIVIFGGSAAFYSLGVLNAVFCIILLGAGLDAIRERKASKEPLFATTKFRQFYSSRIKRHIELKHKPNIYMLFLESYHSSEALQTLYGIDDSVTDSLLARYNFTDYKRVFSNAPATVASLHTLLDCSLTGYASHARENVFVLDVLRENGYSCEFFDSSYFVFGHLMCQGEFAAFDMPPHVRVLYALAGPVWAQSRYLRKLVRNIDPFVTDINFAQIYSAFQRRLSLPATSPRFFCLRFGACHIAGAHRAWEQDATVFAKKYTKAVHCTQRDISAVVETIMRRDSDALVVVVGDHGSLRHSNAWKGIGGENESLQNRGVRMEELALDHFGVRLAVRWPQAHKPTGKILSPVNLFRFVLEALGGGDSLLEGLQPNLSLLEEKYLVVREGKPLEALEHYHPAEALQALRLRFEQGTASLEDCLTLGLALEHTDKHFARRVLEWAHDRYPEEGGIDAVLGRVLFRLAEPEALIRTRRALDLNPQNTSLLWQYAYALRVFGRSDELLDWVKRVSSSPVSPELAFEIMRAYCLAGSTAQAVAYAKNFSAANSDLPAAYYYSGLLHFGLKEYETALGFAEQGMFGDGWNCDLQFHLRRLYTLSAVRTRQWDKAMKSSRSGCTIDSHDVWSWLLWSYICEEQGETAQALQVLLTGADQCSPNDALLWRIGHLARRHRLKDPSLQPFMRLADQELTSIRELFARSGVVDAQEYQSRAAGDPDARFPHRHYIQCGVYQGIEPVPWFDSSYYLLVRTEVWKAGMNPFVHFLQHGISEYTEVALCQHPLSIRCKHPELREDPHGLLQEMHRQWGQGSE